MPKNLLFKKLPLLVPILFKNIKKLFLTLNNCTANFDLTWYYYTICIAISTVFILACINNFLSA